MIDLRKDGDAVMTELAASTRDQIRRAERRDGVCCERCDTSIESALRESWDAFNLRAAPITPIYTELE